MSKKPAGKGPEPVPEPVVVEPVIETGSGEFVLPNGGRYVGAWKSTDGVKVREGEGVYTYGPEEYRGQWRGDAMCGPGRLVLSSGAVYEGEFEGGAFHGNGTYTFPDGATYKGQWHGNKMHGQGAYTDKDGFAVQGEFFNGMYNTGKTYLSLKPMKGVQ